MLTDVSATSLLSANGALTKAEDGSALDRIRIKGIYYTASAAGTITVKEGGSGGTTKIAVATVANASGFVPIPGEGVLVRSAPYAAFTGTVTGVTFFYG